MKKLIRLISTILLIGIMTVIIPVAVKSEVHAQDVSGINAQLLNDINALRASQGLGALRLDGSLNAVASTRAAEAATVWSHTRPNGSQGISMLPANLWRGENLSYVQYGTFTFTPGEQVSAAELMFANLKASPTHYNNMVYPKFTKIGIATYVSTTPSGIKLTSAYMFTN